MRRTMIVTVPAGTFTMVKRPSTTDMVPMVVPTTWIPASVRPEPEAASRTRPTMRPVVGDCARAVTGAVRLSRRSVARDVETRRMGVS